MPKSTLPSPNMFDAREAPALYEAFAIAWRVLTAQHADAGNDLGSIRLQSRIASTIIAASVKGVTDPAQMAEAAIKRCAPAPKLRLAS